METVEQALERISKEREAKRNAQKTPRPLRVSRLTPLLGALVVLASADVTAKPRRNK